MHSTLIAYHYFAHYRLPIMQELSAEKNVIYTFISGTTTDTDIKIIDPSTMVKNHIRWKKVRNIWLFNRRLLWQVGLIWNCLFGDYENIIFLGSPYFLSTWIAMILSRLSGKKVFLWTHGIIRNQKRDIAKLLFYKLAHGLFLYGDTERLNLQKHGFRSKNLSVINNSLDHKKQLSIRKQITESSLVEKKRQLFINGDSAVLLFIGRLTPKKKIDQLIVACEVLRGKGLQVNVLIIGDGSEKEYLQSLMMEKKLEEYIVFYGACYNEEELSSLIALADICVSPGNVGLTCIHAFTYGTPVITHDNSFEQMPEFEAIVPGETGLLFKQDSIDSLVDSVEYWLKFRNLYREQVRIKCYEIVDKYYNPIFQVKVINSMLLNLPVPRNVT